MSFEISLRDLFSNDEEAGRVLSGLNDGVLQFPRNASPPIGTATEVLVNTGERPVSLRGTVIARGVARPGIPGWVKIEMAPGSAAELSRLTLLISNSLCSTEETEVDYQALERIVQGQQRQRNE